MNIVEKAKQALEEGNLLAAHGILGPVIEEINATGEQPSQEIQELLARLAIADAETFGVKKPKN
jgi:hypothetical protein